MAKRFVARKKYKRKNRFIFYLIVAITTCLITLFIVYKYTSSNEVEVFGYMLKSSNGNIKLQTNPITEAKNILGNLTVKNPISILESSFNYKSTKDEVIVFNNDYKNDSKIEKVETNYVEDPSPSNISKPIVYLYNTHQTETYKMENSEVHNIAPNVMIASYTLKENLNNLGINTIVETSDITSYMNQNGMKHYQSYDASSVFIKNAISKNPTLQYFIDIHRDGVGHDLSTLVINGDSYAKVLFVVGTDNSNYKLNLEFANKVNDLIDEKYPGLSRGVITKSGEGVNGIYNQNINPNMLLMECGGYENNITEVSNTMKLISIILKEVIAPS